MSESNRVESNLSRFETNRTFFGSVRFDRIEQPLGSTRFDSIGALEKTWFRRCGMSFTVTEDIIKREHYFKEVFEMKSKRFKTMMKRCSIVHRVCRGWHLFTGMDGGGEAVNIYVSITAGRRLAAPHPLKDALRCLPRKPRKNGSVC